MIPHPVICFYVVLCAVALVAAAYSPHRDRRHAVIAALILSAGCLLSNVTWLLHAIGTWKRIDAAVMFAFLWMLWRDRRDWKIQLCVLAVATMGVHAMFGQAGDGSLARDYGYPAALNALFVLELFIVGRIGAKGAQERGSDWLVSLGVRRAGRHLDRSRRYPDE